jgi:hypothetical protein
MVTLATDKNTLALGQIFIFFFLEIKNEKKRSLKNLFNSDWLGFFFSTSMIFALKNYFLSLYSQFLNH